MGPFIPLIIAAVDVIGSGLIAGIAVWAQTGSVEAGATALGTTILNHFRIPGHVKPVVHPVKLGGMMKATTKTTKMLLLLAPAFLMVSMGCSTLFSAKSQIEAVIAVQAQGTYVVTLTKDGQTLYTETWECTSDGTQLTGCHKR